MERYYTSPEVARMLGVDNKTIHNWANRGYLNAHRTPGGHLRVSMRDIEGMCVMYGVPFPRNGYVPAKKNAI